MTKTIRYTTKMGYTAMPDLKFTGTVLEAKAQALSNMNADTYTISIEDKASNTIYHYGCTGVNLGTDRITL